MPNAPAHEDAQSRVLRFLWRSRAEWSGREIARRVGVSAPACHDALKKLDARGLVLFRRVSNVHLYQINAESYLVRNVFALQFKAEAAMPRAIETDIKNAFAHAHAAVISLAIFGSFARDAELKPGSDLDLLVVVPTKSGEKDLEPALQRLRERLFKRFGLPLSPYVQTLADLRRKHARKLPLIGELLKDGRTIYGKEIRELLA